eukprot:6186115-Pleurochrysis_carterae.AAC.4
MNEYQSLTGFRLHLARGRFAEPDIDQLVGLITACSVLSQHTDVQKCLFQQEARANGLVNVRNSPQSELQSPTHFAACRWSLDDQNLVI